MWLCIGFLTIALSSTKTDHYSYLLGTFSSEQKCLDYGQNWKDKKTNNHTEADYICEENLNNYQGAIK